MTPQDIVKASQEGLFRTTAKKEFMQKAVGICLKHNFSRAEAVILQTKLPYPREVQPITPQNIHDALGVFNRTSNPNELSAIEQEMISAYKELGGPVAKHEVV